jgi:PAS domain S-box-containing protein
MNQIEEISAYKYLDQLPVPTVITDVSGKITFFNRSAELLFGCTRMEVSGKKFTDIFQPDRKLDNEENIYLQLTQKQSVSSPFYFIKAEGTWLKVLEYCSLLHDDTLAVSGLIRSLIDVTDKKRSESDHDDDNYHGIINNLNDAIFIQDENGKFLFTNHAATDLYGYSQEELLGKTPLLLSAANQNDFEEIDRKIKKCLQGESQSLEFIGRKRNGSLIPTEVSLTKGTFYQKEVVIALVHDITDRKLAEKAIIESEEKYKMLVDNAFDAIYLTEGRRFKYINQRFTEITGYTLKEVTDPAFDFDLITTDKSKVILEERTRKRQNDEFIEPTYLFQVKDKSDNIHDVEISTVRVSKGQDISVLGIMRDVTDLQKTNKELEWKKSYFENIYSSVPYGIVLLDNDDHVMDANNAFIEMFQWTLQEMIGKPVNDFIVPDYLKSEGKTYTNDVANGKKVDTETIRQRKDGSLLHVKIIGNPANMPDGNQLVFGIYQDVSESVAFRNEIERQKLYFEQLFQSIPYGIVLIDMKTMIQDCNEGFAKLFGYSKNELLNATSIQEIIPRHLAWEGDDLRTKVSGGERIYKETVRQRKDGEPVDVAITAQLLAAPDGQRYILAVYQDIIDRKTIEKELHFERNLMEALMTNIPDTIYFKDTKSRFLRINQSQAKALGVEKPEDAVGKTDLDFFDIEHALKSFEDERKIFFEGDRLINAQEYIKTAKGWRWFTASKVPMYDNMGQIIGLAGVSRDITDIKNLEQALLDREENLKLLNAEKDKLFSIIAHDLRSPFNSFLMLTEMLMDDTIQLDAAETKKLTASMYKSAVNLYDLLENLLSWSRLQRGLTLIEPSVIQLIDVVEGCLENFSTIIHNKRLEIKINIPESLSVIADRNLLNSIFRNLISNAIKFTPKTGKIVIGTVESIDKQVFISVSDTGIGMNQDLLSKLFSIEIKGRKGTEGEPSSGLGLILVKDFVEKHGGQLLVKSEENKGSTFSFNLKKA